MPTGKKYGGRVKGTPNKSTQAMNEWMQIHADELADLEHPLVFLLEIACNVETPLDIRMDAAKSCLPYVTKKAPTQLEHTGVDGSPIEVITGQAHLMLEELLFNASVVEEQSEEIH